MMLADSDVLIEFLRGREPAAARIRIELGTGRLCTTTITSFELRSGARTARDERRVATLLDAMNVLNLDEASAIEAARVRRELEGAGKGIGTADYLIAGICLAHQATLLTNNRKHFERINGLRLGITLSTG
ncbi:MAG: type II toxin-antitoxin system VapC family toxin [Myxococcota bacterium]|nr:type II toxin-antitoxin system VapC family toxin [Myxococcota bacterium]